MKTLAKLTSALLAAAALSACAISQPAKEGEYCGKCKTVWIQTGPPTKVSTTVVKRVVCPTCGNRLVGCTICE